MTTTTLIVTVLLATLPLPANAKDVKGFNCEDMKKHGYNISCPENMSKAQYLNMPEEDYGTGNCRDDEDCQHRDDPDKSFPEQDQSQDEMKQKIESRDQQREEEIESVGEDNL